MARTVKNITDDIDSKIAADSNLSGLTSTSNTAIYKLIRYVVALAIYTLEVMWDAYKTEVDAKAQIAAIGTPPWFAQKIREFQYTDTITLVNLVPKYAVYNATKQIVKRVAIVEKLGGCFVKVAKEVSGAPVALNSTEKTALNSYLTKIKPAGVSIELISTTGDVIDIDSGYKTIVYYDGQIPEATFKASYKASVEAYVNNIDFNGLLVLTKLEDAIQKADGYVDVKLGSILVTNVNGTFTVDRVFNPYSGYYTIATNFFDLNTDYIAV